LQRRPDTVRIGRQRVAKRGLTDEADNGRRDVHVLGVGPGPAQIGFGVAIEIERATKLLEVCAGEITGPLNDHFQRGDGVEIVAHEGRKAIQEILGASVRIAVRETDDLILVKRYRKNGRRAALTLPIEDRSERLPCREPLSEHVRGIAEEPLQCRLRGFPRYHLEHSARLGG
jgi:hypothetical protein